MFEELFDIAKKELAKIDKKAAGLPEPQVTVLFTDNNNYYVTANDIDGFICNELRNKKDTKIVNMLTMWKNGQVDLASIRFRNALVELNTSNRDANVFLQGEDGYLVRKLRMTLPFG